MSKPIRLSKQPTAGQPPARQETKPDTGSGFSTEDGHELRRAAPEDLAPQGRKTHLQRIYQNAPDIVQVLKEAKTRVAQDQLLEPEHVALQLLSARGIEVSAQSQKEFLDSAKQYGSPTGKGMSERMQRVLVDTSLNAEDGAATAQTLLTVLMQGSEDYQSELRALISGAKVDALLAEQGSDAPHNDNPRTFRKLNLPTLQGLATDLVLEAQEGSIDRVVGRSKEIEKIITVLGKRQLGNPVITGEAGTGKTALAEGLARMIAEGNVPEDFENVRIFSLRADDLCAQCTQQGCDSTIEKLASEISQAAKMDPPVRIILFIDEIHTLMQGQAAAQNLANHLKPFIARGEMKIIGATTHDEFRETIRKDAALVRRFPEVPIEEPSQEEAVAMVLANLDTYADFHGVEIDASAAQMSAELSQYNGEQKLPSAAVDFLDHAASSVKQQLRAEPPRLRALKADIRDIRRSLEQAEGGEDDDSVRARDHLSKRLERLTTEFETLNAHAKKEKALLDELQSLGRQLQDALESKETPADEVRKLRSDITTTRKSLSELPERLYHLRVDSGAVAAAVSRYTNIPLDKLQTRAADRWRDPQQALPERVFGQPEGIAAVARALRKDKTGMRAAHQPIGSQIWFGPTGVGKTELAKVVAELYFAGALKAVSCNELQEPHKADLLFGAPPGYVGFEGGSSLAEFVRKHRRCVIPLDEIEKGHPTILTKIMQIQDQGFFLDNEGKPVDCSGVLLLGTSNLASDVMAQYAGDGAYTDRQAVDEGLAQAMARHPALGRPEIRNRWKDLVVFNPLSQSDMGKILEAKLWAFNELAEKNNRYLGFSDAAQTLILNAGFSPADGGRGLIRTLERMVEDPYNKAVLEGHIDEGSYTIMDVEEGKLVFRCMTDEERGVFMRERSKRESSTPTAPANDDRETEPAAGQRVSPPSASTGN